MLLPTSPLICVYISFLWVTIRNCIYNSHVSRLSNSLSNYFVSPASQKISPGKFFISYIFVNISMLLIRNGSSSLFSVSILNSIDRNILNIKPVLIIKTAMFKILHISSVYFPTSTLTNVSLDFTSLFTKDRIPDLES